MLKERLAKWTCHSCIGDVFLKVLALIACARLRINFMSCMVQIMSFLTWYTSYVTNYDQAMHRINRLTKNEPRFEEVSSAYSPAILYSLTSSLPLLSFVLSVSICCLLFGKLLVTAKHDPRANQLDLASLLIMPIQRVPRYSLLLRDLSKHTWKVHTCQTLCSSTCGGRDEHNFCIWSP